jgi:hypothetical protein
MTIPPLLLPSTPGGRYSPATVARVPQPGPARRVLPLAQLHPRRAGATVYGFGSVDDRGRVAELVAPRAMGWTSGTRLGITVIGGLLVVRAQPDGAIRLSTHGHLRLPAPVRRWCGLVPGDRVLLAADLAEDRLVVHTPAALERMIAQAHEALRSGGAT